MERYEIKNIESLLTKNLDDENIKKLILTLSWIVQEKSIEILNLKHQFKLNDEYIHSISKELFSLDEDGTLNWTEALAYETWNTGVNNTVVGKSADGKGQRLAIWGDSLFIVKEFGVYVLPNLT